PRLTMFALGAIVYEIVHRESWRRELRVRDKIGTGPNHTAENSGDNDAWQVPVPILSQTLTPLSQAAALLLFGATLVGIYNCAHYSQTINKILPSLDASTTLVAAVMFVGFFPFM